MQQLPSSTHISHPNSQLELSVHSSNGGVGQVGAVHQRNLVKHKGQSPSLTKTQDTPVCLKHDHLGIRPSYSTHAVHDADDCHQSPVKAVDDLLLLGRCEIGERVVFERLPLVIALLAILHVRDLLLFIVVIRSHRRFLGSHIGGVLPASRG
jgi:hypothetical protein